MSLASQRAILMRGDPGLFDILKKVAKVATGFIPGAGIARTAAAAGIGLLGGGPRAPIALPQPPAFLGGFPGRAVAPQLPARAGPLVGATAGGCPKGFHPNRSSYHTSQGFVAQGTRCVRNRRRNLSNGRANTRALRRMAAWEKQDKKRRNTLKAIARSAG